MGVLFHEIAPFALTLERPWLKNRRGESCIPAGSFTCKRVQSPHFGDTFEVMDVPGRSAILFHRGNLAADTHGCVLVGEQFGRADHGELPLIASRLGFAEFMNLHRGLESFPLSVQWRSGIEPKD
jgi:hypothetical protein